MSDCSNWWSKKHNNTTWGQNILGITIKIGDIVGLFQNKDMALEIMTHFHELNPKEP